jgi:hypothetical protein
MAFFDAEGGKWNIETGQEFLFPGGDLELFSGYGAGCLNHDFLIMGLS